MAEKGKRRGKNYQFVKITLEYEEGVCLKMREKKKTRRFTHVIL